jgi:hypothetical protein
MNQFDMEIDLGHNAIRLFSTKHCEGKVVYWSPDYLELPFTIGRTGKLVVDAIVNGKSVKARLAPGWAHSSVRSDALAKIGAAAGSKGTILLDSLEFGGIKLPHINAVVYDPEPDAAPITGSHLTGRIDTSPPEFTIGNDVLRRLRLYIAIKENKAYFTLASAS